MSLQDFFDFCLKVGYEMSDLEKLPCMDEN
jgi:hypothetical protein